MQNIYDELIFMGNNVLYAVKDGHAGLINGQGEIIADFIYDDLSHKYSNYYFEENWIDFEYFSVTKDCYSMSLNGKMGVKDYSNNTILDFIYDRIKIQTMKNDKYIIAVKDNQYALFNLNGEIIVDFGKYDEISSIEKYLLSIKKDNKYGCLNIKDNWVIEPQYKYCDSGNYESNIIIFKNNEDKFGIVDKDNNIIAEFKYDNLRIMKPNYIKAQLENKFGIIDNKGNTVIECLYNENEIECYDEFVIIKKQIKTENSLFSFK